MVMMTKLTITMMITSDETDLKNYDPDENNGNDNGEIDNNEDDVFNHDYDDNDELRPALQDSG